MKITLRLSIPLQILSLLLLLSPAFTGQAAAQNTLDGIYVINEGAFMQGNASITRYDAAGGTITQNAFFAKNSRTLGDVANSAAIIGEYLYIIVNNSHTIEVADKQDLASVARIEIDDTDGGSPRYILQVDDNRAFVTNMFGNSISVIDLESHSVIHTFPVPGNPEGLELSGGKVFVALSGLGAGNSVAVVDPVLMEITNTIQVGDNPQVIRAGSDGSIWVLCTGDYGYDDNFNYNPDLETLGEIHIIDAADETVVRVIETGGHPDDMQFYEADNALYILNNGIQRVNTLTFEVEEEMVVDRRLNSFGIIDTGEPSLIGGMAPDFSTAGRAVIFSMDGVPADSFSTGIGPGDFVMLYSGSPVSVRHDEELPLAFNLGHNYPNPFNPSTIIPFELKTESHVLIEIVDMNGRRVAVLANRVYPAGKHSEAFNAGGLASGVYMVKMRTPTGLHTGKMMLLK